MDRIIALLSEKNTNLEKFYYINEQELINFADGNFETVEPFYQARDKILDLVSCMDQLLDEENQRLSSNAITNEQRADISDLLRAKDELVKAILAQDLQLLNYIEKEKSNIIRELRGTGTARRAVGAYANTEKMGHMNSQIISPAISATDFLDEKP
jgi:flagellar biosynthesis/type III secretory pathway chaperone